MVSRASKKKGKGKNGGEGKGQKPAGVADKPSPPVAAAPQPPPSVQRFSLEEGNSLAAQRGGDVADLINMFREEAREADRRHQEQMAVARQQAMDAEARMKLLEEKCEWLATSLAQVHSHAATASIAIDNLGTRLLSVEACTVGEFPPAMHFEAQAGDNDVVEVAIPVDDVDMDAATGRGRKAIRQESPERAEHSDGERPRAKRPAAAAAAGSAAPTHEDYESAADAEDKNY